MNDMTEINLPALDRAVDLQAVYRDGSLETIISEIRSTALAETHDIETRAGRDAVKSLAYKVTRSKTALDEAGKSLTEEARTFVDKVNDLRRKVRSELDEIAMTVRKPLTEWEEKERVRVERILDVVDRIKGFNATFDQPSKDIADLLNELDAIQIDASLEEYEIMAKDAADAARHRLTEALRMAEIREKQEAEIARLRAEVAERERVAREEAEARLRAEAEQREAAEAERRAQEEAARKEREETEARAQEAERRAQEAERALQAQKEAEERKAAAERAERERQAAEAEAKAAAEQAAAQDKAAQEAARARVLAAITEAIKPLRKDRIPLAIMQGEIPHVRVSME